MEYNWVRALNEWPSKNRSRIARLYSRRQRFGGNQTPRFL